MLVIYILGTVSWTVVSGGDTEGLPAGCSAQSLVSVALGAAPLEGNRSRLNPS